MRCEGLSSLLGTCLSSSIFTTVLFHTGEGKEKVEQFVSSCMRERAF